MLKQFEDYGQDKNPVKPSHLKPHDRQVGDPLVTVLNFSFWLVWVLHLNGDSGALAMLYL